MYKSRSRLAYSFLFLSVFLLSNIFIFNAHADLQLGAEFSNSYEYHSEVENELNSSLTVAINDEVFLSNATVIYDLETLLIVDHENNRENEQFTGNLDANYEILNPTLTWDFNANIVEISQSLGSIVDDFNSQSVTTVSTGPVLTITESLRGEIQLEAKTGFTEFSASNLDTTNTDNSISYLYPVTNRQNFQASLIKSTIEYDDLALRASDSDITSLELTYSSVLPTVSYNFMVGTNEIEGQGQSIREPSYLVSAFYQLNSVSDFLVELSNSIESSSEFNATLIDVNNPIFLTGFLRNERLQAGYNYFRAKLRLSLFLYSQKTESIFSSTEQGRQTGASVNFSDELRSNTILDLYLNRVDSDLVDQDRLDVEITLSYDLFHSRKVKSRFSLMSDNEETNGVTINDVAFFYAFTWTIM